MLRKLLNNQKGLTLIEILVSITLIGLVLIPLVSYVNDSRASAKRIEDKNEAIRFAQMKLEDKIADTSFWSGFTWNNPDGKDGEELSPPSPYTKIDWDYDKMYEGATVINNFVKLELTVSWRIENGKTKDYTLVTYRSK